MAPAILLLVLLTNSPARAQKDPLSHCSSRPEDYRRIDSNCRHLHPTADPGKRAN